MAMCDAFVEFGATLSRGRAAEIGMHLHAWNLAAPAALTDDDFRHQPF